ncbi:uncharacterized protein LOC106469775 [Limulus polyphemus]|uniref:Uncharacterized protein LOC106469775 n=1 Tax=Limulus polyphemus TaxID=6850 RepID=A0ABM1BNT7_LIMPO|nr:uncharacterized protein LOC106469775 [Limulus polyphemus]XP_022254802.1 uncharacterized protein LOC106469775 [Limulus polyphemus]
MGRMDGAIFDDTDMSEGRVVIYLGIFGVIILLICLICYCCNKKIYDDDFETSHCGLTRSSNVQGHRHIVTISGAPQEPVTPSPPPPYDDAIKKGTRFQFDQSPPSYEVALSWQNFPGVHNFGLEESSILHRPQYQILPTLMPS